MHTPSANRNLTLALLLLTLASQACVRRSDLDARAVQLAGPRALDCGHLRRNESSEAAMTCAEDAMNRRVPFRVSREGIAIDSYVVDVLVGSPGGKLTWLRFDTDASGGSRLFSRPRLFEWACSSVSFPSDPPGQRTFQCERASE